MSFVTARRVRGTRGHRLGNLGFAMIDKQIQVVETSTTGTPTPPRTFTAVNAVATSVPTITEQAPVMFFLPMGGDPEPPPAVIDTDGEVISESSSPAPGITPLPPGLMLDGSGAPAQVTDLSPTLVPTRPAWKTWLPIGLAVAGIAGAVYILRKK
jgi:hypothetical protein